MKSGWRLRPLVVLAATTGFAAALAIVGFGLRRYIGLRLPGTITGPASQMLVDDVMEAYAVIGLGVLIFVLLASFALATRLARPLAGLRTATDAMRRGESAAAGKYAINEYDVVANAVARLDTDRRARIDQLDTQRRQFAMLVESVSEAILQVAPDGRLSYANPAASALLGLPASATGQPVAAVIRHAELRHALERCARGEPISDAEFAVDERRLVGNATALPAGGAVVAFVDLTEVRRLEGVRRDFVANVSHELKTPLTSIRGYVETLMSEDLPQSMRTQFLEVIRGNAARLQGIVDDLLDLSRLESGGWRPEPVEFDALSFVREAWTSCSERAAEKDIAFNAIGEDLTISADPGGLRQVLANLYDNAIRHTGTRGRIDVTVRAAPVRRRRPIRGDATEDQERGGTVIIEIRDTGSGIPKDSLPRIFERFYRVDPARSRAEGGTGLGLSIVKHLIESMDGTVTADSDLGKGTTVAIRLPGRRLPVSPQQSVQPDLSAR